MRSDAATVRHRTTWSLLLALDYSSYDGPWKLPQDFRKVSAIAEYSRGTAKRGWSVTGMGYDGRWDSTDQIPLRATRAGCEQIPFCISRFGYVDPTDGGESHRKFAANHRRPNSHPAAKPDRYPACGHHQHRRAAT